MINLKDKIELSFDRASKTYDSVSEVQILSSSYLSKMLADCLKPHDVNTVIDIGSGTGNMTLELMKIYSRACYTLCDISKNMIDEARRKVGESLQADYINCDAEKYNFVDKYDLGISNLAMQWFESIDLFLEKILKNCHYFAFSSLLSESFHDYRNLLNEYNAPDPTFCYPSFTEMKHICQKHGKLVKCATRRYDLQFATPLELAKYFRELGAAVNSGSKNTLSLLCKHRRPIDLNYEVFFAIIEN